MLSAAARELACLRSADPGSSVTAYAAGDVASSNPDELDPAKHAPAEDDGGDARVQKYPVDPGTHTRQASGYRGNRVSELREPLREGVVREQAHKPLDEACSDGEEPLDDHDSRATVEADGAGS